MYKISNLKLDAEFVKNVLLLNGSVNKSALNKLISDKIGGTPVANSKLTKLSLDAREKPNVFYVASATFDCNSHINLKKYKSVAQENIEPTKTLQYNPNNHDNIIIVGSGPSGLFSALALIESGKNVTIVERGYSMEKRIEAVDKMLKFGVLDEKSNIQFGEGGAGTFSDGKLNSSVKSEYINYVLETFYKFGANEDILYSSHAHIGTDVLRPVIVNIRKYIESKGSTILFEHNVVDVDIQNGKVIGIEVETSDGKKYMPCNILIMGIGHSSRDTIKNLYLKNLKLIPKPFSLGYRIEHLQKDIDMSQYGKNDPYLPPADYHLSTHLDSGRCVYTFCMCPGGVVVPATSESGHVVTNGMSYFARDGINANSALLCSVNPSDFESDDVLAGIDLQEKYERLAYTKTNSYKAVVQRVGDFLQGKPTTTLGKVKPTYKPGYELGSVEDMLPQYVVDSIKLGIVALDKKLFGFASPDAILTGIETRSSAPYQVVRNLDMTTSIGGFYMIGEGAGMAGGIMSSAVDGIKCANAIIKRSKLIDTNVTKD